MLLKNLQCAVNNGTMAYLCFDNIDLKSQAELDALRNLCHAAFDKGWQVLLEEAVDFNQEHCLVLIDVVFGGTKTPGVHEYCTARVEGDKVVSFIHCVLCGSWYHNVVLLLTYILCTYLPTATSCFASWSYDQEDSNRR